MKKITTLNGVAKFSKKSKKNGKTIGLILGSFDILHMGHINLFRFAKKHADFLIVGLDSDKTIRKTKGQKRPINNSKRRSKFLSEIGLVDKIFVMRKIYKHGDKNSFGYIESIFRKIKPTHIFTSIRCDSLWQERKKLADSLGIKFIPEKSKITHTSDILKILESEI